MNRLLILCVIAIVPLLGLASNPALPRSSHAQQETTYAVYLPFAQRTLPPVSVFGIELSRGWMQRNTMQERAANLDAQWVRFNMLNWEDIQPEPDTPPDEWNWAALESFEREILAARAIGAEPIVIVDTYPSWARMFDASCSALKAEYFNAFAFFMRNVVDRYSQEPYTIRYWELGNEPDVDPRIMNPADYIYFGCWGNFDDPYYGGEHFGNMLNVVTPAIKAVDPKAKVIMPGLLLDRPETTSGFGRPELFLEGVLRADAAPNFDIVAYHSYPLYFNNLTLRVPDADLYDFRWGEWGGMTIGKARFLREMMNRYGVSKPLMLNETALILYEPVDEVTDAEFAAFQQAQANYGVHLLARGSAIDLMAIIWYTFNGPGWRATGLLDADQQPRPVYTALEAFLHQTAHSEDTTDVSAEYGAPFEAYRFHTVPHDTGWYDVDVVWSLEPTTLAVTKNGNGGVFGRDGATLTPVGETTSSYSFEIGLEPVYIRRALE